MMEKIFYIYKVTNLINNKIYIGQRSTCVPYEKDSYIGSGVKLGKAKSKYGKDNFKKELIEICKSIEELNEREIFWIKELCSMNPEIGYNLVAGGRYGIKGFKIIAWNKGIPMTEEVKEKLRKSRTGVKPWNYGLHSSDETKKKISESRKGMIFTEERRLNISRALLKNRTLL